MKSNKLLWKRRCGLSKLHCFPRCVVSYFISLFMNLYYIMFFGNLISGSSLDNFNYGLKLKDFLEIIKKKKKHTLRILVCCSFFFLIHFAFWRILLSEVVRSLCCSYTVLIYISLFFFLFFNHFFTTLRSWENNSVHSILFFLFFFISFLQVRFTVSLTHTRLSIKNIFLNLLQGDKVIYIRFCFVILGNVCSVRDKAEG